MAVLNFQMSALFEMIRQLCHFTCCMCRHHEKTTRFLRVAYRKQLDNWKKTDKERRRGQQLQAEVHVQKDQQRSGIPCSRAQGDHLRPCSSQTTSIATKFIIVHQTQCTCIGRLTWVPSVCIPGSSLALIIDLEDLLKQAHEYRVHVCHYCDWLKTGFSLLG